MACRHISFCHEVPHSRASQCRTHLDRDIRDHSYIVICEVIRWLRGEKKFEGDGPIGIVELKLAMGRSLWLVYPSSWPTRHLGYRKGGVEGINVALGSRAKARACISDGQALDSSSCRQVGRTRDARREPIREAHALDGLRRHSRNVPTGPYDGKLARQLLR